MTSNRNREGPCFSPSHANSTSSFHDRYDMEAHNPPERRSKHQISRSATVQPAPPARVSTAPQSSKKSHLPSLHHSYRHHHHHAKDTIQSAIQLHPPTSLGDLLKRESRSSTHSPAQSISESRRESVARADGITESSIPPPRPVRPEDVVRERNKAQAREEELRTSLQSLSEQSLKTTRRLDDTYYSILEKITVLRSTIGNLQELSGLTKQLHDGFQADADGLTQDISGQIDSFNNFEGQQRQLENLETQIAVGREKANTLNARLEAARKRVEARAQLDREADSKTARRLAVLWSIVATVTVLILALVLFQRLKPIRTFPTEGTGPDRSIKATTSPLPDAAKEILDMLNSTKSIKISRPASSPAASPIVEDPRLRIFDEL